MTQATKTTVKLGDIYLAATDGFAWRMTTGPAPYQTVVSIHKSQQASMEAMLGQPQILEIKDARGRTYQIREVYPLYETPSAAPNVRNYVISDMRWKLPYSLVVRDYNHTRKTGDRNSYGDPVPAEVQITADVYQFRSATLRGGSERWTGRSMLEDVLEQIAPGKWFVQSFPASGNANAGGAEQNQITIQNISLRDSGDVALGQALAMVPGADVFVSMDGFLYVFDALALTAAQNLRDELPPSTYDGERSIVARKAAVRPRKIYIYYQREVEVALDFSDDWGDTVGTPNRARAYMENVLPTVDIKTQVNEYDPDLNIYYRNSNVRQGCYVRAYEWLEAMQNMATPAPPFPWEFDTIRRFWVIGDLDGVLGAGLDRDSDPKGLVSRRVSALRQHFRTTFRINQRMMGRVLNLKAERVAVYDAVNGIRAPAAVWGQCCIIPSTKGQRLSTHKDEATSAGVWRNVDGYPQPGNSLLDTEVSAAVVNVFDEDQGIIQVSWLPWINGTVDQIIPCLVTNETNQVQTAVRDLGQQDSKPLVANARVEGTTADLLLSERCKMRAIVSIVPGAPNNLKQLHREEVPLEEIAPLLPGVGPIEEGTGPDLHVFVPPSEAQARFGYHDEQQADFTLGVLLGLANDDPASAGIEFGQSLDGYEFSNYDSEIKPHSRSFAAELMSYFVDMQQGRIVTELPGALKIRGNMSGASVVVAAAPSTKCFAIHEFATQSRPVDRLSLLPESARHLILGTLKQ